MKTKLFSFKFLLLIVLSVFSSKAWGQYTQITTLAELTSGQYLIVGDGKDKDGLMLNTTGSGPIINFTSITNPPATISSGYTGANEFTITVTGSDITIFHPSVGYVSWGNTEAGTGTANHAGFNNGTTTNNEIWTATVSAGLWTLANKATPTRLLQWNNGSPRFAAYTSVHVSLKLYKKNPTGKTVTFKGNGANGGGTGGTGADYTQSSPSAANLTTNTFTRTGYTFNKWNTISDGTGTDYTNGQSYDFSADMPLYAQWQINQYNVSYNANASTSGTCAIGTIC